MMSGPIRRGEIVPSYLGSLEMKILDVFHSFFKVFSQAHDPHRIEGIKQGNRPSIVPLKSNFKKGSNTILVGHGSRSILTCSTCHPRERATHRPGTHSSYNHPTHAQKPFGPPPFSAPISPAIQVVEGVQIDRSRVGRIKRIEEAPHAPLTPAMASNTKVKPMRGALE